MKFFRANRAKFLFDRIVFFERSIEIKNFIIKFVNRNSNHDEMKIIIVEKKIIKNVFDVKYDDDDDVKINYDDRLANFHHDVSQLLNRNVICAKR